MKRPAALLSLLVLVATGLGSPIEAAPAGLTVTLSSTNPETVPQGSVMLIEAVARNDSSQSMTIDLVFSLFPEGDRAASIDIDRWSEVIPANTRVDHPIRMATSQWFAERGPYKLTASQSGEELDSLAFTVTRSNVRVPRFQDVTGSAGVATTLPEFACGNWSAGAAWADVDGDKDEDLFLPRRGQPALLWINNDGTFVNEAAARGVEISDQALGAVFADYDNDSDQDLYVNIDGPNRLFQNDGTGSFQDVTSTAGVGDEGPSQSASWGDFDGDGWLDLYVTNHAHCAGVEERTYYADKLYHNEGDGTFSDQTALLSDGSTMGAGFQTAWFDYDNDGDQDLYLANDFWGNRPEPNFLWRNDGASGDGWTFSNESVPSGLALSMNSMGLALGDYDRDLDIDVGISNIYAAVLMNNQGDGTFVNRGRAAGIARSLQVAGSKAITWGTSFGDLNNDGWEDLYFAAGRLGGETFQPNALFTNGRNDRFLDHSVPSGTADTGISRGVALADFDRDGRLDLFVVNQGGEPHLYRNTTSSRGAHWFGVDLVGSVSNRDGCGARVTLTVGGKKMLRQVYCGGTSLGSGSSTTLHFGLGKAARIDRVAVLWPSGRRQVKRGVSADRLLTITEPAAS